MRMLTALNQKIEELLKDGIRQNLFVELYMWMVTPYRALERFSEKIWVLLAIKWNVNCLTKNFKYNYFMEF